MSAVVWKNETRIYRENEAYYEENDGGKCALVDMLDKSGVLDGLL